MTPKEKAKDLFTKFVFKGAETKQIAIESALIVVDEINNDYSYMQKVRNANSNQIHSRRVYWQEVKQEIEKQN